MRDGVPSHIIFMRVKQYFVTCFALSQNFWILGVLDATECDEFTSLFSQRPGSVSFMLHAE